jgi:hypothetical protein
MLQIVKSLAYDILIPWPTDLKLTHSGKLDVCDARENHPIASDMKFIFFVHITWPRPPTIWQMLEMGVVCCTFQSIFGCQKLFCYYALF